MTVTLHEDLLTFKIMSGSFCLKCFRHVFYKNENIVFVFSNFFPKRCTVYELTWKNAVEP
jgi:hypothetical protein